jgi:putative FmdB family regulatory protein
MPIYEYKCENGHVFDVMQKMSDEPMTECIECGALVRKVLQPVGISFKGSGFYSTDYDNKKGPKSEPKEAANTSSDSSSNGASDSKDSAKGGAEKKPVNTSTGTANKGE